MTEPRWLTLEQIKVAHERQLARFGGPAGIRDEGALVSAMMRPVNRWQYEQADLPELAAAYAFGLARNHPFVDGNKRTAYLAGDTFLRLNGQRFTGDPLELARQIEAVLTRQGSLEEAEAAFVEWLRARIEPRE